MTWRTLLALFPLTAVAAVSLSAYAARADELFSRVSNDSVFTTPASPGVGSPESREPLQRGQRILSVTQLRDVLRDAGLEPDNHETIATVQLQHARWTFSVRLGLTEDRDQLVLLMLLTELDGKQTLPADKLLALLGANAQHRPACFSFSDQRKRIELLVSLDNAAISPRLLREELRKLATIAENTASLWEISGSASVAAAPANAAPPPPSASATNPGPAAPPAAAASSQLVGKWSASRSATEAFAMQLNADGTFVLVYVKDGKQSRSTGKFTLASGQLILNTKEGSAFGGGLANLTARSFDFTPQGASAAKLTFQRAS